MANCWRGKGQEKQKLSRGDHYLPVSKKKPVTAISGDSMVQNIKGWELLGSNKLVVKSFSRATTADMKDYVLSPLP